VAGDTTLAKEGMRRMHGWYVKIAVDCGGGCGRMGHQIRGEMQMTRIQEVTAKIKALRAAHRAEIQQAQQELQAARDEHAESVRAKKELAATKKQAAAEKKAQVAAAKIEKAKAKAEKAELKALTAKATLAKYTESRVEAGLQV
jgi:hypothetical protein